MVSLNQQFLDPLASKWHIFSDQLHRLPKLSKRALVISLGLGASVAFNYANYRSYWNYTIYHTQTVDFGLLANILPRAIKDSLANERLDELSSMVDSHYNVFGILISRYVDNSICKSERFVALSGFRINDDGKSVKLTWKKGGNIPVSRSWAKRALDSSVSRDAFIRQLELPGVYTQGIYNKSNKPDFEFKSAVSREPSPLNISSLSNKEAKIGNIYFIRNPAPPFLNDVKDVADRLRKTSWTNIPDFLASRQGVVMLTYISFPLLFLILFELAELRATQVKLNQVRLLNERELDFFRTMFAARLLSSDVTNFSHDLATANQKIIDMMNTLAVTSLVDICNINHDITKAPLVQPHSISNSLAVEGITGSSIIEANTSQIIDELKNTHDQLEFVVKNMRTASNTDFKMQLNLNSILERLKEFLPPTAQSKIVKLNITKTNQPLYVYGNEWHLFSILRNIFYNSTAAMKKKITSLPRLERNSFIPMVCISTRESDDNAEIVIEDNGPGIPPDKIASLYRWTPDIPSRLSEVKNGGYGSDIVATYLYLNRATVTVSNIADSEGAITGARVVIKFKQVNPSDLSCQES